MLGVVRGVLAYWGGWGYLPMYGRSPEGLYTYRLFAVSYPVRMGVKADVFLQCVTTLAMGGKGLSRPGENLRLRSQGLGLRI